MPAPKRILLVEDHHMDVELALTAFRELKLAEEVAVARDGAEALDYLLRRGVFEHRPAGLPAVVLLDLKLPKVDGFEVLGGMKSHPELKVVPVVVMTSSRQERDLARCYELGANAYLVKPVDFRRFVQCLAQVAGFWLNLNEPPPGCVRAGGESGG
jgi:CheY-like chemotaxis protein